MTQNDPRQYRQTAQVLLSFLMIIVPVAVAKPFDWRALLSAALGGILAVLTNPRLVTGLQAAMPDAGSSAAPPPGRPTQSGKVLPLLMLPLLLGSLASGIVISQPACHSVTPDKFLNATVDCAKVNPQKSAALASVESCLLGVVAQNPSVCLSGLVTDAHFMIDEVACVVAYISQQTNAKVASKSADTPDLVMRQEANRWLTQERIQIVNSYPTK